MARKVIGRKAQVLSLFLGLLALGCSRNNEELPANQKNDVQRSQEYSDPFAESSKELPIYQYYQKIPRVSGVTNDLENLVFNLQIELGYDVGDVKTLEKLNKSRIKIAGELRQSIAKRTKLYLGDLDNYLEIEQDILELVNKIIAPDPNDAARVKDAIITELFLHDYR